MLRIGHRGAAGHAPENTLLSIQKALDAKVDMVEFDVHVCRTGEVVLLHDSSVNRTTNGDGYIFDLPLQELQKLDAGKGQHIPLLGQALDLIDRRAKVNIELKGEGTGEAVSHIINHYISTCDWHESDFFTSSFLPRELQTFRRLQPDIDMGVLMESVPHGVTRFARQIRATHININEKFISPSHVRRGQAKGFKIIAWTVNKQERIKAVTAMGVDGIISDFPERITAN